MSSAKALTGNWRDYSARGPDGTIYPWGDEFNPLFLTWHTLYPANVGSIASGASWVGAYDLSGGVLEWVSDWFGPYLAGPQTDPPGPASGDQRGRSRRVMVFIRQLLRARRPPGALRSRLCD